MPAATCAAVCATHDVEALGAAAAVAEAEMQRACGAGLRWAEGEAAPVAAEEGRLQGHVQRDVQGCVRGGRPQVRGGVP